jgi:hypothetical protein
MATIEHLDGETVMYSKLAKIPKVGEATKDCADKGEKLAHANLEAVRGSSTHTRFWPHGPYDTDKGALRPDAWFSLEGSNAMALEFGHNPSGVFGGTDTAAPEATYILTGAGLALSGPGVGFNVKGGRG